MPKINNLMKITNLQGKRKRSVSNTQTFKQSMKLEYVQQLGHIDLYDLFLLCGFIKSPI